jgi:hypothetical protein
MWAALHGACLLLTRLLLRRLSPCARRTGIVDECQYPT